MSRRTCLGSGSRGAPWQGRQQSWASRSRSCRSFLNRRSRTILAGEVGFLVQLFNDLNLLCHVFWVGVAVEPFVARLAEPPGSSPQLVGEVSVVVLLGVLPMELLRIGGAAPQGEVSSGVLVSGLDILIVALVPGELRGVGAELGARPVRVQQVLGGGPFNFVSVAPGEPSAIGGVDVQVGALELVVFFVVVDQVGHMHLVGEALLVDRLLGEVGLDHVEFAEVAPTGAIGLDVGLAVEVFKVGLHESAAGLVEVVVFLCLESRVPLRLRESATVGGTVPILDLIAAHSRLELGLELWFGGDRGVAVLREGTHGPSE